MAEWFAPTRYGLGSGLPIAWQGWVAIGLFMLVALGASFLFEDRPLVLFSIMLPAVGIFLLIAARTTRGGWRWRWGEKK